MKALLNPAGPQRLVTLLFGTLTALITAISAVAADYEAAEDQLITALSTFVGQAISIDAIRPSPAPGIVEVKITDGPMIYATEDGEFFFLQGDLHGMRDGLVVNVTEEGRVSERRALVDAIDVDDMIVFSPEGETKDYITVFTDVSCGYCQKLHREVADLNGYGIEVRYLAYPRAGVNSEGARQLETAWCADDPKETLTKLKSGVAVPNISCDSERIAEQYALGTKVGVRGTPAILTSDGRLIPGYQPAQNLAKTLGLD